jgi:aminoglycoside 6-adenylyltransferase
MNSNRDLQLEQVLDWANANDDIRAVLLTSSLVNPYAPVDRFSDLDIELVVKDLPQFLADDGWIANFGTIVAMVAEDAAVFEGKHAMKMVFYWDYSKIDFKIWSVPQFRKELQATELPEDWDIGYKILLDKDGLTTGMQTPSYSSVFICKPPEQEYKQVMNDFWWDMTYVAKCLWRDDLFYAKFMTEDNMRTRYLQRMIEWYIGLQHDWNVTTNKHGRLFKQFLSPEMWMKVEATFSGCAIDDNWRALFAYADLGRELGHAIAAGLGYTYPVQLDENISVYLRHVKTLGKNNSYKL